MKRHPTRGEDSSGDDLNPLAAAPFRNIFTRSLNAMLVADDHRRYVEVNPAACRLLRRSREQLLSMTIDDVTAPASRRDVGHSWETFVSDGVQAGRYELLLGDGSVLEVEYSAVANFAPGRHLSILVATAAADAKRRAGHGAAACREEISPREREVLTLVAMGATSRQIADELHLSPDTVRTHVRNVMGKLGSRTRAHAIGIAIREGLIQEPA